MYLTRLSYPSDMLIHQTRTTSFSLCPSTNVSQVDVKDGLFKTIAYFRRELEESGEIVPTGPFASKPQNKKVGGGKE